MRGYISAFLAIIFIFISLQANATPSQVKNTIEQAQPELLLPWVEPSVGYQGISGGFSLPSHKGVDFNFQDGLQNDFIYASASGEIVKFETNCIVGDELCGDMGFGNFVKVQIDDTYSIIYSHLDVVRKTEGFVERGEILGEAGNTGKSSGDHLHFELREGSSPISPIFLEHPDSPQPGDVLVSTNRAFIPSDGNGITLWEQPLNSGQYSVSETFSQGKYPNLDASPIEANTTSYVVVPPGWILTAFTETSFNGESVVLGTGSHHLSDTSIGDNSISSIIVEFVICEPLRNPLMSFSASNDPCNPPTDITPPSGSIQTPLNGEVISDDNVSFSISAQDNAGGSGVREVLVSAKWNNQWHDIHIDSSSPYSFDWKWCESGVPDGDVELGLQVRDNAGNNWVWSEHQPNIDITKKFPCSHPSGEVELFRKKDFEDRLHAFSDDEKVISISNPPVKSMRFPEGWSVVTYKDYENAHNPDTERRCWSESEDNLESHDNWSNDIKAIEIFYFDRCPPETEFDAWPQSGQAPLTVRFHIVSASEFCNWDYGDGNYHSTCDTFHDYTYTKPGVYSVWLNSGNAYGSDRHVREDYITVYGYPNSPSNLRSIIYAHKTIWFTWDDNSDDETEFRIYRWGYDGLESRYIHIDTVGPNTTTYQDVDVDCGQIKFYAVTAINSFGESPKAEFKTSTLDCPPPEAPVLKSPADGSSYWVLVLFDWEEVLDAHRYEVQVDNNSDFSSPEISETTSQTSLGPKYVTDWSGSQYWRVRAYNDAWGPWSIVYTLVPPPTPTPSQDIEPPTTSWIKPVGDRGAVVVGNQLIQLEATASDNVGIKKVYFSRWDSVNEAWVSLFEDSFEPYYMILDTTTLNDGLNQINVLAEDFEGNFSSSPYIWLDKDVIEATITPSPTVTRTPFPTATSDPQTTPLLQNPPDSFVWFSDQIHFSWTTVGLDVEYQFQMDNHEDFSSPETDFITTDTTYLFERPYESGKHQWRVRAKFAGDDSWGPWSGNRLFFVASTSEDTPTPTSTSTLTAEPTFTPTPQFTPTINASTPIPVATSTPTVTHTPTVTTTPDLPQADDQWLYLPLILR